MTPAVTGAEKVRFHTLDEKTGNRFIITYLASARAQMPNAA